MFSRWYLIAKCIKFSLEVDTPIFLYNHMLVYNLSTLLIKILLEWSAKDLEMLQANIEFRLQHTKFSVLRLIPRLWYSYYLKFQNSKLKFEI